MGERIFQRALGVCKRFDFSAMLAVSGPEISKGKHWSQNSCFHKSISKLKPEVKLSLQVESVKSRAVGLGPAASHRTSHKEQALALRETLRITVCGSLVCDLGS